MVLFFPTLDSFAHMQRDEIFLNREGQYKFTSGATSAQSNAALCIIRNGQWLYSFSSEILTMAIKSDLKCKNSLTHKFIQYISICIVFKSRSMRSNLLNRAKHFKARI